MRLNKMISRFSMSVLAMLPLAAMAATASPNPDTKQADYNILLISLVGFMIILLFVIGMLANTLRLLSIVLKNKNRERARGVNVAGTVATLLFVAALLVPGLGFAADAAPTAEVVKPTGPVFIQGIPEMEFYTLVTVIAIELAIVFALAVFVRIMLRLISEKPELAVAAKAVLKKSWLDKLNNTVALEKEKDILIDHNYDGIQELDNSLPPWWKYGFYLTIVVSVIYIYRFHISHDGMSQQEEFVAAMEKGEEEKRAYLANSANNIDESSVTMLADAGEISAGKEIFIKNCAACHLPDGGGVVGPNLTDDYWLHGGSIKDVFKSIKYGWQDKGMKAWKDDFSPKQLQQLASFVKSLKGTKPAAPKAPQGDIFIEGTAAPKDGNAQTTDNSKTGKVAVK